MSLDFRSGYEGTRLLSDTVLLSPGDRDLSLKLFSGKVLETFRQKTIFWDGSPSIISRKELSGGSSYQWPIIGDDIVVAGQNVSDTGLDKGYHTPGKFIYGSTVPLTEITIAVPRLSTFSGVLPSALRTAKATKPSAICTINSNTIARDRPRIPGVSAILPIANAVAIVPTKNTTKALPTWVHRACGLLVWRAIAPISVCTTKITKASKTSLRPLPGATPVAGGVA